MVRSVVKVGMESLYFFYSTLGGETSSMIDRGFLTISNIGNAIRYVLLMFVY